MLLWYKALHVFFMIAWMAGLFYIPRLFIYNVESKHTVVKEQLNIMQRRLWFFVTPFALLTLIFGILTIYEYGIQWFRVSTWLHIKIALASTFYVYHMYLLYEVRRFVANKNRHGGVYFRFVNEVPVFVLFAIVVLAIVKPFF